MLSKSLDSVLIAIKELRAAVEAMEARGERVPFEVEEKLHLVEERVSEMAHRTERSWAN